MKPWDGYDKNRNERTKYDTSGSRFLYWIDDGGTIFYSDLESPNDPPRVWCSAPMLTAHLMRLYQIRNRKH